MHSPPAPFLSGDQLAHTNPALFDEGSVHSGSACRDDCGRALPDESVAYELVCMMDTRYAWIALSARSKLVEFV